MLTLDTWCILQPLDDLDRLMFIHATPGAKVKYRKKKYNVDAVINQPYGSVFELTKRSLQLVDMKTRATVDDIRRNGEKAATAASKSGATASDNRNLVDNNTAQKLKQSDVQAMKDSGASAGDIISSLVANSSTFSNKTEFSQAKYIKKKQKQFAPTFRIVPCSSAIMVDALHFKDARRICGLRSDGIAQLLARGNIRAFSKVIVVENAMGLVVGSAAERMMGNGTIINLMLGDHPNVTMVPRFNLPPNATEDVIVHFPFTSTPLLVDALHRTETETNATEDRSFESWQPSKHIASITQTANVLKPCGADSFICVVSEKYQALSIFTSILPLLVSGASFSIFCPFIEPLKELHLYARTNNVAVDVSLTQLWVREFQVLPGRTRPR